MAVVYNAKNDTTFSGATTKSCSVNCSGTYRYAVAHAISDEELPSSVTYGGVAMTLLDSYSNQNGWWIGEYGLQDPATGAQTVLATWPDSQPNCWLGVEVASSSTAAITVEDFAKNVATTMAESGTVAATCDSTSGQLAVGLAFTHDVAAYGEGYTPSLSGSGNTNTVQDGSGDRGATQGMLSVAGSTVTATLVTSNSSGNTTGFAFVVSLTDAGGGGGATDLVVADTSTGHASDNLALTQVHILALADSSTGHSSENIVLTLGGVDLAVADTSTGHASDNLDLVENVTLTVAATSTAHASDNLALTQDHTLAIADSSTAHASSNLTLGGVAPTHVPTFDCACGTTTLAVRNVAYAGADTASDGFKLQFCFQVEGGGFSSWADITEEFILNNWPFEFGSGISAGDVVGVKLRAVNDAGDGDESAEQEYRTHHSWHRPGARRSGSGATGHASGLYDVVATDPIEGPLTTGGTDRAVLAFTGVAYGSKGTTNREALEHSFRYNGVEAEKIFSYPSGDATQDVREENGGCGGTEGFVITGVPSGSNTAGFDWDDPVAERAIAFAAVALKNVHQSLPIASYRTRKSPDDFLYSTGAIPGVNLALDATYDDGIDGSHQNFHCPDVPASYDELILSFHEGYGASYAFGTSYPDAKGQAASGWTGGIGTSAPDSGELFPMAPSNELTLFAGVGNGQEDACRLALYADGAIPDTMPLHMQRWHATKRGWGSISGVAVRPSPNMLSSVNVTAASTGGITWQGALEVNHGSELVAIVNDDDPTITATQLWDELFGAGSDYSGTIHLIEEREIAESEIAATGGTLTDSLSGLTIGDYKLCAAHMNWQGLVTPSGNIGTVQTDLFSITDVGLTVADTSTGHSSENLDLVQTFNLAVDNSSTAHASDNLDLTGVHTLAIDGSSTGLLSPNISLTVPSEGGGGSAAGFVSNIVRPIVDKSR